MQTPAWQLSAGVQRLLSALQATPSALAGFEQRPVDGAHWPAVWHVSRAEQTTGLLPWQAPPAQTSIWVQPLPSVQVVPSALVGFEQTPVDGAQVPTSWHMSRAVQETAVPTHAPAEQ